MRSFKEVSIAEVLDLIREADAKKAFLPSVSEPDFSVEGLLLEENFPSYRLFGIKSELGRMAGFICIKPKGDETVFMGPMFIGEAFRGEGLGKWQVWKLLEWVSANNLHGIWTKTWGENLASRKIFEDLGFKFVEEKVNARINGDSTVIYYREVLCGF